VSRWTESGDKEVMEYWLSGRKGDEEKSLFLTTRNCFYQGI
jgi:DNA-directed RNA polymerase subunit M/transcription elongation factor TFIIS